MIDQTASSPKSNQGIFISYSKADNLKSENSSKGWVDSFIELLQKNLDRVPGLEDACSVWTDQQLAENGLMTPELITKIENSPIFVIVLSSAYLQSEWCSSRDGSNNEIPAFLRLLDSRLSAGQNSVFILEKTETPADRPPEFDLAPLFRFWVKERNCSFPHTFNASLDDINFLDNLNDLALDIARELRRLKKEPTPSPDSSAEELETTKNIRSDIMKTPHAKVFLAYATSDLNPLRKKVKRYLEQANLCVVPEMSLSGNSSKIRAQVEKNLAESDMFVQLLGYSADDNFDSTNESLTRFQYRRAIEMGLPVMQWRNRGLTADEIEKDIEDRDHRSLLLESTVQAIDIEDFNRDIVKNAKPRMQPETVEENNLNAYLCMNMPSADRPAGIELCDYLEKRGLQYTMVTQEGRPNEIRQELTTALLETDGMIVVYDDPKNFWVKKQLNEVRKILQLPFARYKESNPKLVYKSPPEKRPHHGIQLKNMMVVDCADGFDATKLDLFLNQVEENAQQRYQELQQRHYVEVRDHYDVFLAHNSIDKPFVREIYTKLKEASIHPWLDEREIMPGHLFQQEIQSAILKCSKAAILIGKNGLGAWQQHELQSLVQLCIENGLTVIPVLLPEVNKIPDDLLFLKCHHWVKFNDLEDLEALEHLINGIQAL